MKKNWKCKCITCGYNRYNGYNHIKECRVPDEFSTPNGGKKGCMGYRFEPLECFTRLFPWFFPCLISIICGVAAAYAAIWLKTML